MRNRVAGYVVAQIFSLFTGFTSELHARYINDCIDATSASHFFPIPRNIGTLNSKMFFFHFLSVYLSYIFFSVEECRLET